MTIPENRSGEAPIVDPHVEDPLRTFVVGGPVEDPEPNELLKGNQGNETPERTPSAGRTAPHESVRKGPRGILQMLGPGLITGASDDDPSGIGTYSQVGSQYGLGLLWMAPFTFPLMAAFQELCARIALHTGVGLGVSLREKFPAWLVGIC